MRRQVTYRLTGSEASAVQAIVAVALADPVSQDAFSARVMHSASRAFAKMTWRCHNVAIDTDEPEHQPREHPVRCRRCFKSMTANISGVCDNCEAKS